MTAPAEGSDPRRGKGVAPVAAGRPRLLAVLSYDPEPGKMLTEHTRKIFYGRVA